MWVRVEESVALWVRVRVRVRVGVGGHDGGIGAIMSSIITVQVGVRVRDRSGVGGTMRSHAGLFIRH